MHRYRIANHSRTPDVVTGLVCTVVLVAAVSAAADGLLSSSPRFYDDDPMVREVDTKDASGVQPKSINLVYHEAQHLFATPGDDQDRRALNVNTIDEVPDSSWFVDRILPRGGRSMSVEDVARGPGTGRGPAPGPWTVLSGKREGITPGFTVRRCEQRTLVHQIRSTEASGDGQRSRGRRHEAVPCDGLSRSGKHHRRRAKG